MKKLLLVLVLSIASLLGLTSCNKTEEKTPEKTPVVTPTPTPTPAPTQPVVPAGLKNAQKFVKNLYINTTNTPDDYEVVDAVTISGEEYKVAWSVEVKVGNADDVKIVDGTKIQVNSESTTAIEYTLTATITAPNGTDTITQSFDRVVPAFKVLTYAEYYAAAKDDIVAVEGIVSAIFSKAEGASYDGLYVNALDSTGGYYVYSLGEGQTLEGIEEGMKVLVKGTKDIYSGTHEVVKASLTVTDSNKTAITPVDLTEVYKAATSLDAPELAGAQALLVTIKGVTITTQEASNGYYRFKLGELESYVRVSSSVCPIPKADQAKFIADHGAHTGWTANVTGVVSVYDGKLYLTPVDANAFEYVSLPAKSDADAVAFEKEGLNIATTKFEDNAELTLPLTGAGYTDVNIAWASNSEQVVIDATTGKATITLGEEDVTVKLTATLSRGTESVTKEFELTLLSASKGVFVSKPIESPVAGTFVIAMNQTATNGKVLYFNGELNSKGALMTTEKADKAVSVVVEVVEGGFALKVGDKYLEGYLNGTYKNLRLVDNAAVWTWNEDAKVFVCDIEGINYYFGDRDRGGYANDTMALSDIKYITGDNLSKIGVSQFPGQLGNFGFVSEGETPEVPETPEQPTDRPALETNFETTGFKALNDMVDATTTDTTEEYYAIGYVKEITNSYFGNMTLEDAEGNILNIYGLYSFDGVFSGSAIPHTFEVGDVVVVYGKMNHYAKNSVDQMKNAKLVQVGTTVCAADADYKLNVTLKEIAVQATAKEAFELPTTGTTYTDVTIAWASNNAAIAVDGANATVTQGSESVEVTLTATFTIGEKTSTQTYKVTVLADVPLADSVTFVLTGHTLDANAAKKDDVTSYFAVSSPAEQSLSNYVTANISGSGNGLGFYTEYRLYVNTLTLTAAAGYKITSIEFSNVVSKGGSSTATATVTGVEGTITATATAQTVSATYSETTTEVVVNCTAGQFRFTTLTIKVEKIAE